MPENVYLDIGPKAVMLSIYLEKQRQLSTLKHIKKFLINFTATGNGQWIKSKISAVLSLF